MNSTRSKFLTAIIAIAMLTSIFASVTVSASLTTSNQIVVNSNAELDALGLPGAGTALSPKIISNLSINAHGGTGIVIGNVTEHVTIYNCTITNSSYGIKVIASNNVIIDNNTINGVIGTNGIYLESSATLTRNKLTNCSIQLVASNLASNIRSNIGAMTIASSNTVNGAPVVLLKNENMDNASVSSTAGEVILLNVTYANVSGLNMHGGVILFWCSHIKVNNNVITGTYFAVSTLSSNNDTITNNRMIDTRQTGVRTYGSSNNLIANNNLTHLTLSTTAYGIAVLSGANNVVVGNTIFTTYEGIVTSDSNGNNVTKNIVNGTVYSGIVIQRSNSNVISGNIMTMSTRFGIHLENSTKAMVSSNNIKGAHDCGISMFKTFDSTIKSNLVFDSTNYAIRLTQCNGAFDLIYANVLVGNNGATSVYDSNKIQAFDDSNNQWNNATIGNYWSDWQGADANHDGIVDTPYAIGGGVVNDNKPLSRVLTFVSPNATKYTNVDSVTVSGTAVDAVGIVSVTWHNQATGASGSCSGTTNWTATVPLVAGNNDITVNMTDARGFSLTSSLTVIYDLTVPTVSITAPSNGLYNTTGSVMVAWSGSDDSGIAYYNLSVFDGTTWDNTSNIASSVSSMQLTPLGDGSYTVYLEAVDLAGNSNQASVNFTVAAHLDVTAPTVTAKSPEGVNVAKGATVSVLFSEAMNETATLVTVNGVEGTLAWRGNNATFTPSAALAFNTVYTVIVTGKDLAGNDLATSWTFTTLKDEGIISSTLKDANSNPIAGATVTLSNGMNTTTDANGYFVFKNVTSGTYTLTISKTGYQTITKSVTTAAGETNSLTPLSMLANGSTTSNTDYTLPIVAVIVVIVALLGGGYYMLMRRKK